MKVKNQKTVRFDALSKDAGQPEQVTLWTRPEEDRDFMRAVKENRVVTVIQRNVGTQKDYGLVGFYPQQNAGFLVYPRRLDQPHETKVVGIKYEKLATPRPKGPVHKLKSKGPPGIPLRERMAARAEHDREPARRRVKPAKAKAREPEPPKLFTFRSRVELKATQTSSIEVEATSAKEAARLARARAEEITIDPAQTKVTRKVGKPQTNR